jgi:hypothetical protein
MKPSIQIAAAKRMLRRLEEDYPHFLNRIADIGEEERALAIRTFEQALSQAKQKLEELQRNSN